MPTIITHAATGLFGGIVFYSKNEKWFFWVCSLLLPSIPDLDFISFRLGIPYDAFFGHRGFSHSILFAVLISGCVTVMFFRKHRTVKHICLLWLYFSILTASHGLLDALTSGGLGVAFLSPFNTTRYFFPCTPIKVSPLDPGRFLSARGVQVILSELKWVWAPMIGFVSLLKLYNLFFKKPTR